MCACEREGVVGGRESEKGIGRYECDLMYVREREREGGGGGGRQTDRQTETEAERTRTRKLYFSRIVV